MDSNKTLLFDSAIDMAKWIIKNVPNTVKQEHLMEQAIRQKQITGTYQISVSAKKRINLLSLFLFKQVS